MKVQATVVLTFHAKSLAEAGAVLDDVRHDQREREEEQAEDEVAPEAVSLAFGNAGRPEGQRDPDADEQHRHDDPAYGRESQNIDHECDLR